MITFIILGLLFAGELFFLAWNWKEKTRHQKEKLFLRLIWAFLLILFLLTGTHEVSISEYTWVDENRSKRQRETLVSYISINTFTN